ncbi:MAG: adenylate kinase [Candidatus Krumholzibacteriia bacterium]
MNVIIMGPPGCGKGTQAATIIDLLGVVHISTGDMLRAAVGSGSELGHRVQDVMNRGELVSDDLMMEIIRDRLQQDDARERGWLLDGFPRTLPQADGLMELLEKIDQSVGAVISLEVPDEEIVRRLSGRLTCRSCGFVTHRDAVDPARPELCPRCGEPGLYQREDDTEATVRNRLQVYRTKTYPAAARLGEKYPLHRIDGTGAPQDVSQRIRTVLA